MKTFKTIINNFRNKNILVIGDLILDQHIQGHVSRISPEAPVPVVHQENAPTYSPGGAANVANNLRGLGASVTLVGRIGNDSEGRTFVKEIVKRKISSKGVFVDHKTPTILKTRIIAQHQQVLRLDRESSNGTLEPSLTTKIYHFIQKNIESFDAVIVSDYGKGLITADLLKKICSTAKAHRKILTVDPKDDHFNYYRGVTAITPNKKETENAIRNIKIKESGQRKLELNSDRLYSIKDSVKAGRKLLNYLKLESLLLTLGEDGMLLFEKNKSKHHHIHTQAQEVFDVTGAGDTVISVFTLCLAAGASKQEAAELANFAAGIVVGKMGAVAISKKELVETVEGRKV